MATLLNTTWTISDNNQGFESFWANFKADGVAIYTIVSFHNDHIQGTWSQGADLHSFVGQFVDRNRETWEFSGSHEEGKGSGTIVIGSSGKLPFKMVEQSTQGVGN